MDSGAESARRRVCLDKGSSSISLSGNVSARTQPYGVVPDQLRESFSSTRAGFCQLDADQTYPYPKSSDTNLSRWRHCALAETVAVHLAGH